MVTCTEHVGLVTDEVCGKVALYKPVPNRGNDFFCEEHRNALQGKFWEAQTIVPVVASDRNVAYNPDTELFHWQEKRDPTL